MFIQFLFSMAGVNETESRVERTTTLENSNAQKNFYH